MLHEVAAGDLAPGDIANSLRRILRHVNVIEADVQDVDLDARKVRCVHGLDSTELEFDFDHLLLALGSETNFFENAGIRDWAVTMKNLTDAALLRNRMVAFLEEATVEKDTATRRQWLTFVIAGGGFAGAETAGAVNDFVRETAKFYPHLGDEEMRVVVIHPGDYLLPNWAKTSAVMPKEEAGAPSGGNQRCARRRLRRMGCDARQRHIDSLCDPHLDRRSQTQSGRRRLAVPERERANPHG